MANKRYVRWRNLLCASLLMLGCKKPFTPTYLVSDSNRYLVIEGTINGSDSTFIKLSRSKKIDTLKTIDPEVNAAVSIENDGNSSSVILIEKTAGIYTAPPVSLDVTRKYR